MAKTKNRDQNDMFTAPAQTTRMPEGYYSGDKPNPNLRAFVEAHIAERPYDPETDDYDVPAFDTPIETTKATAIYNMHRYWSKKPHDAVRQYVQHFTKPGDLVLDPFCGSGGTALAALMEGRKAVAIDRSPAATFITKNYCTPVDPLALQSAYEELERQVRAEIDWLYETRCDRCGGKATTEYTVYSQIVECARCLSKVPLFDCATAEVEAASGRTKTAPVCPVCLKNGRQEMVAVESGRHGTIPVRVSYRCLGRCKPAKASRLHNDPDRRKKDFFERYDLGKIAEIEAKAIPHWIPPQRMMNVEDETAPWGEKWRAGTSNFRCVTELYTKRNLWALAAIRSALLDLAQPDIEAPAAALWTTITTLALNGSRMLTEEKRTIQVGTYYFPPIFREIKVLNGIWYNTTQLIKAERELRDVLRGTMPLIISTQSATSLSVIPTGSVDYIFTDPPYSSTVQYGELNFIWESWLGFDTAWHGEEIIVNSVRGRTEGDWAAQMRMAIDECHRVLRPGRWLSLCYHDTAEGTWELVQDIMAEAGFVVDATERAVFIDAEQKSYNQLMADKVTKRDLVLNFRKPKPGEAVGDNLMIPASADVRTFRELAHTVIRHYLESHPGSTKDRVYDALVSHMVRAGQMQAHDFEGLLREVADEVREPVAKDLFTKEDPNIFGTHEIGRWYLKETEADFVVDAAESAREDRAAVVIEKLIAGYLKEHRGTEGVHYSDLFEHYLYAVKDKPRRQLAEWLPDYFYKTPEGMWRLPETPEERATKAEGRVSGTSRRIRRYATMLEQGVPIPPDNAPSAATLAEWIRHTKKAGLYLTGKLLYERGGLDVGRLSDVQAAGVEEDYEVCIRALGRGAAESAAKKTGRKKKGA